MKNKVIASILTMAVIMCLGGCGADKAQGGATPGAESGKVSENAQADGDQDDVAGGAEENGEVVAEQTAGYVYDSGKEIFYINPDQEYAGKTRLASLIRGYVVVYDLENPIESKDEMGDEWCYYYPANSNETWFSGRHNGEEIDIRIGDVDYYGWKDNERVVQRQENGWTQFTYEGNSDTTYITFDHWEETDNKLIGYAIYDLENVDAAFDFLTKRCTIYKAVTTDGVFDYANAVDAEGNTLDLSEVIYSQDMYIDEMKATTGFTFTSDMDIYDDGGEEWALKEERYISIQPEADYTIGDETIITAGEDMASMDYHGMQIYYDTVYTTFYYQINVDDELTWVRVHYSVIGSDLPDDAAMEEKVTLILDTFL